MAASNCRLGVVGVGPLVGLHHAQRIVDLDGADLRAVCDLDPSAVAAKFAVAGYTDPQVMMEKEDLDGVILATPTHLHLPIFKKLVAAEKSSLKAVLVEKPICESVHAAEEMISLAESVGVKILVGHQRRHSERVKLARELVCNKSEFGQLRSFNCQWVLLKPDSYFDAQNPARAYIGKKGQGGPILINLIHDVDLIRYITGGEIVNVFAATSGLARENEVEDTGAVTFVLDSGAVGSFVFSDAGPSCWNYEFTTGENKKYPPLPASAGEPDCYQFYGGKQSLGVPSLRKCSYGKVAESQEHGWDAPLTVEKEVQDATICDPLRAQMEHFIEVCKGVAEPLCSGYDGLLSLVAIQAIEQSAATGSPVRPGDLLSRSCSDGKESKLSDGRD